eukprot:TRINITY_DN45236_c0_g1_i1.p1 TRINITY_DN45236_c0_g1~~TRINITY_DN45236_c0_g1_i1.p1  ORF type:complete len:650 (-),score=116.33 TRINITY_DN45236_c0_g1_i1:125-2074(-)
MDSMLTTPFQDLEPMLEHGKKAYEAIMKKHIPEAVAAMDGHCTFVWEWVREDMPLVKDGDEMVELVRGMIGESCYQPVPSADKDQILKWEAENVLVFADQGGLCKKIVEKAPEGAVASVKYVTKPARLLAKEDIESVLKTKWDLIILGTTLDSPKGNTAADVIAFQAGTDKFVFQLLQKMVLTEGCCKRFAVLTHDAFAHDEETHKNRGLSIVSGSSIFGMICTGRQELEGIPTQHIDVEYIDSDDIVPFLSSEIWRMETFGTNMVRQCWPWPTKRGIRLNKPTGRYVYRQNLSTPYEEEADKPFDVPEEGTIAISGGNGALGLVMGNWLLGRVEKQKAASGGSYQPKLTIKFLSRSAKISDLNMPLWAKVQSKAATLGVEVKQDKVDMGSQKAVDQFISEVTPNLLGFIHSAGVLQDSMLPNQTWEKFEAVYDSKHRAALYLHDALERMNNPKLAFFWVFSSTSAYGNMGQANYSASNSCLDGLIRHRVASGLVGTAQHWGAWGEVGMAATMDDLMRNRVMMGPMPYFSVAQGLQGLEGGLRTGLPEFSVFIVNPPVMFGMVQGDEHPNQRYARNGYSLWLPTPLPSAYTRWFTYDIYRMYRYIMAPYVPQEGTKTDCIYWMKFIEPPLKQAAIADDDEEQVVEVEFL